MPKRLRSPSYPAIDLEAAIRLAEKVYPAAKNSLGTNVVAEEWGYKSQNSASPYIAALKKFGLFLEENGGKDRMLRFSDTALDILVDSDRQSAECRNAIRKAAVNPSIHREMWDKWGRNMPPDAEIRRYLERERNFNPNFIDRVIAVYKETIAFANSYEDDTIGAADDEENGSTGDDFSEERQPPKSRQKRKRDIMAAGIKEDVYTLSAGDLVVQWPTISQDEIPEVEGWFQLIVNKIKRHARQDENNGDGDE